MIIAELPSERTARVSSRSITDFSASSLVCTSPLAVIIVVEFLDILIVSNSAELNYILRSGFASHIHQKIGGKRVCGRERVCGKFRSKQVSKEDLNTAELETVRISKQSDNGCDNQRRSASKRRGNGIRPSIGLFRDGNAF